MRFKQNSQHKITLIFNLLFLLTSLQEAHSQEEPEEMKKQLEGICRLNTLFGMELIEPSRLRSIARNDLEVSHWERLETFKDGIKIDTMQIVSKV